MWRASVAFWPRCAACPSVGVVLPVLARAKLRLARPLPSSALRGDGILSLAGTALATAALASFTFDTALVGGGLPRSPPWRSPRCSCQRAGEFSHPRDAKPGRVHADGSLAPGPNLGHLDSGALLPRPELRVATVFAGKASPSSTAIPPSQARSSPAGPSAAASTRQGLVSAPEPTAGVHAMAVVSASI
jgi:hypothetical protein